MLITIVGKSGSGKSTITNKLIEINPKIKHLNIDKIAHYVNDIPKIQEKLVKSFGKNILKNEKIDRKALATIVFNNKTAMRTLTEITYPEIEKIIDTYLEKYQNEIIILDWQLLPKTKYLKESNLKILVTAPLEERIERIIERDNITKEKFLEREKASLDFSKEDYDIVIENSNIKKIQNNNNIESRLKKIYEKSIISSKF